MVTLQILVLSFQVRILVLQQKAFENILSEAFLLVCQIDYSLPFR